METIFDHNITDEEKRSVIGTMTKDLYFKVMGQETSYYLIAKLYYIRNNEKEMNKYLNKIPLTKKMDFLRTYSKYD